MLNADNRQSKRVDPAAKAVERQSQIWSLVHRSCKVAIFFVFLLGSRLGFSGEPTPQNYQEGLVERLKLAERQQIPVIKGGHGLSPDADWLFFTAELRAVLSPQFWGEQSAKVSRSSNPKFADPLPPIVDFHRQLKAAGIELLIVPVPAKIAVYPKQFMPHPALQVTRPGDGSLENFYVKLHQEGIQVIDLTGPMRIPVKKTDSPPSFCRTDSHWSGTGVRVAAQKLGETVKQASWYQALPKTEFQTEPRTVEITGDLALLLDEKNPMKEKLSLTRVFQTVNGKQQPVADDPNSPILLLGDSHTLVFHDPTMFAEGCGLADHLAEQTGIAIDVIGVRGSGANAARLNWRRRADPLKGKKLVIWCFSMREFTENTDGWRIMPIVKPKGD